METQKKECREANKVYIQTRLCIISKIIPCEKARERYSGQRQQHTKSTGVFRRVARCALEGLLWEDRVPEGCEGWAGVKIEPGWPRVRYWSLLDST